MGVEYRGPPFADTKQAFSCDICAATRLVCACDPVGEYQGQTSSCIAWGPKLAVNCPNFSHLSSHTTRSVSLQPVSTPVAMFASAVRPMRGEHPTICGCCCSVLAADFISIVYIAKPHDAVFSATSQVLPWSSRPKTSLLLQVVLQPPPQLPSHRSVPSVVLRYGGGGE